MAAKQIIKAPALKRYGLRNEDHQINYQCSPEELQRLSVERDLGQETDAGVLVVNTGEFTGRSPKDRFIVKDEMTRDEVWWGDINIPFDPEKFDTLYHRVVDYLSEQDIYVRDSYACAADDY